MDKKKSYLIGQKNPKFNYRVVLVYQVCLDFKENYPNLRTLEIFTLLYLGQN